MSGKIIGIVILVIVAFGLFVPLGSSGSNGDSSIAVTYGETTYNNHEYKQMVDEYFEKNGNVNLNDTDEKVITSNDVNRISSGISQRTYNSNQIFSCAMVDLNGNNNIKIDVDPKITTVTPSMYKSALDSAGIKKGHVVVTSPVTATGESALAGIMKAYETATGQLIPEEVKNAANNEIYTQSEVVNNTNLSADDVAQLVDEAKEEVAKENTTDKQTIINIVNNIASNNNIQIAGDDINNLADSIQQTQSVQDQASQYQSQVSNYVNSENAHNLFDMIWRRIQSFLDTNLPQK
ncbi:MAG: hypothetical protein BZ133_06370 [Methanosphaera sp. SHI613]|jgi:uncharacterized protein YpuA (DUF1002 family)|nr:MAG: hypothetical protein BZ133_06370 [Methanosphaera sp. SHI613]